ncbi:MAG TPA: GNAT family N-acetyltransferase [Bacteroidales bacterium]|nr:GNAT family N-acetyltransferase [Bacteroidales bacterium]
MERQLTCYLREELTSLTGVGLKIEILNPSRYAEWNNFVDSSPQGDVFCYSWWLDVITKSKFKIFVVIENNEIVAGIPAAYDVNNKINEPPLTRTLGVLYKLQANLTEHKQSSYQRKWLSALLGIIKPDNFVQMCTHHSFRDWLPFRWHGLKQTTRYTYIIHYQNKTPDSLLEKLNRGKKSIIKIANKYGIKTEVSEDIEMLYYLVQQSYKRQGKKLGISLRDLINLDEAIKKNGNRLILNAIDCDDKVHAAIYLVFNKKSVYYLLSGCDSKYRDKGSQTLILWEAVKYFCDKVQYFNFGGSDIKNIEEHVRCFGGELTPYFHIYNERNLHSNEIKYHLKEIVFHLKSLMKSVLYKLSIG